MARSGTRKHVFITEETQTELSQLVSFIESENKGSGLPKVTERQVIEEAISYYHSSKFGKEVFDNEVSRFQLILSNTVELVLKNYADKFANALNSINKNSELSLETSLLLMVATGVIPNDEELSEIVKIIQTNKYTTMQIKAALENVSDQE